MALADDVGQLWPNCTNIPQIMIAAGLANVGYMIITNDNTEVFNIGTSWYNSSIYTERVKQHFRMLSRCSSYEEFSLLFINF